MFTKLRPDDPDLFKKRLVEKEAQRIKALNEPGLGKKRREQLRKLARKVRVIFD